MQWTYRTMSMLLCVALVLGMTWALSGCGESSTGIWGAPPGEKGKTEAESSCFRCPLSGKTICPQTGKPVTREQPCPHCQE